MSFQQFLHEKLGLPMPPQPELTEEQKQALARMNEWKPADWLEESFSIPVEEKEFNEKFNFGDLVREYYQPLTTEVKRGPLDTYSLHQKDVIFSLWHSQFPERIIVTVEFSLDKRKF